MSDISVLLNFTSKITFEETDPLMSIVCAGEPLLFYDRLSVEKFPEDDEKKRLKYVQRKIANLRNLLEARAISVADSGDNIRLIFILDLACGLLQKKGELVFPAQKARFIRDQVRIIFGESNPILRRMEYAFIFINSDSSDPELTRIYQTTAYDGGSLTSSVDLNTEKNSALKAMQSPDEDADLDSFSCYENFLQKITDFQNEVHPTLEKAGVAGVFKERIGAFLQNQMKTVKDFKNFDFDTWMKDLVRELVGVTAEEFKNDCVFFILKVVEDPFSIYLKDELFVKALVQLLSTVSRQEYVQRFKTPEDFLQKKARLFLSTDTAKDHINKGAMEELASNSKKCSAILDDLKWSKDMEVTYIVYTDNTSDTREVDTHKPLRDKYDEQRKSMRAEFDHVRSIPFFFGPTIGDWSWYCGVVDKATAIYEFERENGRPLYDQPHRITNQEMSPQLVRTTYRGLEDVKIKLEAKSVKTAKTEDIQSYLADRQDNLDDMEIAIEAIKKEMPKLGYFKCLFWMGFFSILAFVLCFANHFWGFSNTDPIFMIAIAAGAVGGLFVLASVIGQICVKHKIQDAYLKFDAAYDALQNKMSNLLSRVNNRAKLQREADIRRRNMEEMESKLNEFKRHNKRIDLWMEHFASIAKKVDITLNALNPGSATEIQPRNVTLTEGDFSLSEFPALPATIRSNYAEMPVSFRSSSISIGARTSFVKYFNFTEVTL